MFVDDVIQFIQIHEHDISLVYPANIQNGNSVSLKNCVVSTACNSYRCHNGKKHNQDRLLLFFHEPSDMLIAGVFDGHGREGGEVASFFRNAFLLQFLQKKCVSIDDDLESSFLEATKQVSECTSFDIKRSGTTAFVLLLENTSSRYPTIHTLNVGDSECCLSIQKEHVKINQMVNICHHLEIPEERSRIEKAGGYVLSNQLKSYLPSVLRVFANPEGTRGGLTMSRSIGDLLIHRFGIISDPSKESIQFTKEHVGSRVLIILGSDGLLSYMQKEEVIGCFEENMKIEESLKTAIQLAQARLLKITGGKYADDASGIAISFQV